MILLYLVALSTTDQYLYIAGNWVELKKTYRWTFDSKKKKKKRMITFRITP